MTPQRILVPIDFSEPSISALDYACALAGKLEASIHLVTALDVTLPETGLAAPPAPRSENLRAEREGALEELVRARRAYASITETLVRDGDPGEVILAVLDEVHADLIVMGTHGHRGMTRMLLGSVAEYVVRRAPCPVVTVRSAEFQRQDRRRPPEAPEVTRPEPPHARDPLPPTRGDLFAEDGRKLKDAPNVGVKAPDTDPDRTDSEWQPRNP